MMRNHFLSSRIEYKIYTRNFCRWQKLVGRRHLLCLFSSGFGLSDYCKLYLTIIPYKLYHTLPYILYLQIISYAFYRNGLQKFFYTKLFQILAQFSIGWIMSKLQIQNMLHLMMQQVQLQCVLFSQYVKKRI